MHRDEILAKLRERIVAFVASRGRRDWADDVAQDVMLLLHTKYGHLDDLKDLVPVAITTARLTLMGRYRKHSREGPPVDESLPDHSPSPDTALLLQEIKARIALLGDRCRDLLRLKLEGKTFAEIQAHFQVTSINTIYTWDARCHQKLREALGQFGHLKEVAK